MAPTENARGYETRDAQIRWIVIVGGLLALLCVVGFIASSLVMDFFVERADRGHDRPSPLFVREVPEDAPLLTDEPAFAKRYITSQKKHLESYGWVDRERGIVHIPIERAMAIELEERGEK